MAKPVKLVLAAAVALSALSATSVSAVERQRKVEYADLDLSTHAGQTLLKKRIKSAVISVCAQPGAKSAADRRDQKRCETRARTSAMRDTARVIALRGSNLKVAIDQ
jgi:UrcA family protein